MRGFAVGGPRPRFEAVLIPGDGSVVLDHESNRMSREYKYLADTQPLAAWLNDRWRGYPSLKRFEGGANYPTTTLLGPWSDREGATWTMRICKSAN